MIGLMTAPCVWHRLLQAEAAKRRKLSRQAKRLLQVAIGQAVPLLEQSLGLDQRRVGWTSAWCWAHRLQRRLDRLPVHLRPDPPRRWLPPKAAGKSASTRLT
jgi:hypothetical protein